VLRRRRFFAGVPIRWGDQTLDIAWLTPAGQEMTTDDWHSGFGKSLAVFLNGDGIGETDTRGNKITDDSFFICFNAHHDTIDFHLPSSRYGLNWEGVLDSAHATGDTSAVGCAEEPLPVRGRSVLVLRKTA
ncbi:MAG: glycogen debranching enzyme GlgX, partial [Gordonia sp.]|nr:glycogen debranching enzyme GlgX [Gordonia sp. (in: high G+C Gram-positive bacteria)]